ncbi:MAG: gfo/Idh/MocA family oxidoreductase [Candidatus Neomarinimicrobiota bacterium]|nr:MAG: gfo/Idh/MocA family oxidoreductase [Candidatus Neomarinimicrobiota bacterium]
MNVGVIGLGYWGPNLVRNFFATPDVDKVYGVDVDKSRLELMKNKFPMIEVRKDYKELLEDDSVDAIAIATPVSYHYQIAREALQKGKHVLIEKPMTSNIKEAEELVNLAEKNGLVLMVDHTFLYTGAVRKIKELIEAGEIGDLYYFDSVRVNLGLFQHDINVIWDLAPHDLSIMTYIVKEKPVSVAAFGSAHYNGIEDIAYIVVNFDNSLIAHFHVNWLAPVKVRQILISGTKKMIVYDDTEPSEKVKVYDKGIIVTTRDGIYQTLIQYRTGDMYAPKIDSTEALSLVCKEFVESIKDKRKPLTDGMSGLEVVRMLELAEKSLKSGGKCMEINREH